MTSKQLFNYEIRMILAPAFEESARWSSLATRSISMMSASRTENAKSEKCEQGCPRILVVDDVTVNREILKRWLSRRGFSITEAADGYEALRIVEQEAIDLILLDIMMPKLNGTEVVRAIRRTRSQLSLPIIMVSAKSFNEDVAQSLDIGANAYITKPVDFKRLLPLIEELIYAKRSEEAGIFPEPHT